MNRLNQVVCGSVVVLVLSACSSSDSVSALVPPPPPPPPTEFTMLVKDLFAATSDTTDPVDVDDQDLAFSDNENETAYDDLLQ